MGSAELVHDAVCFHHATCCGRSQKRGCYIARYERCRFAKSMSLRHSDAPPTQYVHGSGSRYNDQNSSISMNGRSVSLHSNGCSLCNMPIYFVSLVPCCVGQKQMIRRNLSRLAGASPHRYSSNITTGVCHSHLRGFV